MAGAVQKPHKGADGTRPKAHLEREREKNRQTLEKPPLIKVTAASLETVCGITSRFPENDKPEFAFAGKSNVGKSSLINTLLQRKALARTSATPGKTQTVNFYLLNEAIYLVDLPGYGFTKISPEVKAKWGRMVERYLAHTKQLRRVFLLVDMRHKPTSDDCLMYDWIKHNGFTPVVVATKQDKLKKSEIDKAKKLIRETLGMEKDGILIPFSSETKFGRDAVYALLSEALPQKEETEPTERKDGSLPQIPQNA